MICGIGVDLVEPKRVERLLDRYGERFARRVLTPLEWPQYANSARPAMFLANRFAAKEAFSKAVGVGLRSPVTLQKISVVQDRLGKPSLAFHGDLEAFLRQRGVQRHHLSISNEQSLACAFVVLED
ncbi:MAG: holo-ACP synthase [Betaproteobacteria bacterium]|nr:holo-ACP synthase [Betaproteobacteria bacterium]